MRLSAPRERLSGYWRLAVPFPAGRGRHGEPGSGHLGTSFLQVHSGGMYAAYGLVSQRPFAVLDRHLLGTAKGLQTKGCSVGGDRAPSHSCDRRRKEKSGQAHSGRARPSEKALRLPLRHVPRKQWRRQGRPHQGRSPLESRESRQVVRQEFRRFGQALKLSARLPVCTTEGAWATPRTKHGIIALSVKLTRVAGDKRPGCPQCGNAIFKPSQRIWDVACCIWRPVREAPILRIRAK